MKVKEFFENLLPQKMPDYELRQAQVKMAELVRENFLSGGKALIEAGTGTGKSLAYLVPSLLTDDGSHVSVSTGTKNLQEQLYKKDLPFLQTIWGKDFSYMLVQGRSNYLCLTRLVSTLFNEEERLYLKKWANETPSGNLNELTGKIDWGTLKIVAADPDFCLGSKCTRRNICFLTQLRLKAENCKILVVNHHLLLTDLIIKKSLGFEQSAILPPLSHIVLDEAHHLEEVASECFGEEVFFKELIEIKNQVLNSKELQRENLALWQNIINELEATSPHLNRAKELVRQQEKKSKERLEFNSEIALVAENIHNSYAEAFNLLQEYGEEITVALGLARKANRAAGGIRAFLNAGKDSVSWANKEGFHNLPLKVDTALNEVLFEPHNSVVLTSATLSTSGNFSYLKSRLGIPKAQELVLESPFNFNKVLLAVPNDLKNPNSEEYTSRIAVHLKKILPQIKGGSFILCTSFKMLNALKEALKDSANLYIHGEMNPQELINSFKKDGTGVLIGVDSFWEGVDVPGDALKAVFITKMPFPVPSEPLFEARKKLVEERGGNSFRELSLPIALLKLRQGFGRLIRRQTDEGLVVIYDSRVLVKSYGKDVFSSLPKCSEWRGPLDEMATYIKNENNWNKKLFKKNIDPSVNTNYKY